MLHWLRTNSSRRRSYSSACSSYTRSVTRILAQKVKEQDARCILSLTLTLALALTLSAYALASCWSPWHCNGHRYPTSVFSVLFFSHHYAPNQWICYVALLLFRTRTPKEPCACQHYQLEPCMRTHLPLWLQWNTKCFILIWVFIWGNLKIHMANQLQLLTNIA